MHERTLLRVSKERSLLQFDLYTLNEGMREASNRDFRFLALRKIPEEAAHVVRLVESPIFFIIRSLKDMLGNEPYDLTRLDRPFRKNRCTRGSTLSFQNEEIVGLPFFGL